MNWIVHIILIAVIQMLSAAQKNKELNLLFTKLYNEDQNTFKSGQDYMVNIQQKVFRGNDRTDVAQQPLFAYVNEQLFETRPTFSKFIKLLNNYNSQVGIAETVTREEIQEQNDFIQEILKTNVMKNTHKYLVYKKLFSGDLNAFGEMLKELWFTGYTRSVRGDSSAFEHVFVGETRGEEVLGFHNWVQFYLQEKNGNLNYYGWKFAKCGNDLISITFKQENKHFKPITSLFLGSSPEFELALYTVVFLTNPDSQINIDVNGCILRITCYPLGKSGMGTCYIG